MRDTETIDPMWEGPGEPKPGPPFVANSVRLLGGLARRVSPALVNWAAGMAPELRVAWGARVYHLRRDGVVSVRRPGDGFDDNPRRNYNEAVAKRQVRGAATAATAPAPAADAPPTVEPESKAIEPDSSEAAPATDVPAEATETQEPAAESTPDTEPAAPSLDLSAAALAAGVAKTMGITDVSGGSEEETSKDPDAVKEKLVALRTLLQSLDDVGDFDLVEAVDEELYLLHKAVEYKMKNHKASEAKARLNTLFK